MKILRLFPQKVSESIETLGFPVKLNVDLHSRKTLLNLVKTAFCNNGKRLAGTHIKPVVFEDLGPFPAK